MVREQRSANDRENWARRCNIGLFWVLVTLVCVLPLPYGSARVWAWSTFEIVTALLSLVTLALVLSDRLNLPDTLRPARGVLGVMAALLLWQGLQLVPMPPSLIALISPHTALGQSSNWTTLSQERFATQTHWGLTFAYAQLFLLVLILVNSRVRITQFIVALTVIGATQASYGTFIANSHLAFDYLFFKEVQQGIATGSYVNRNHLAGFLGMTLCLGIGLMVGSMKADSGSLNSRRETTRRLLRSLFSRRSLLRILLLVSVIGLVMTRSRMGNVAFFASLSIGICIWFYLIRHHKRNALILFGSLLLVDLWVVGNFFGMERVVDRLQNTTLEGEQRDEVIIDSLTVIADFPIFGTGAGSFYAIFPTYQNPKISLYYDHAHNDYAQFAVELGLPGLALLAAFVLPALWAGLSAVRLRRSMLMKGLGLGASMGIMAMLIHATTDFNLRIPANAALFMVVLAFAWISRYGLTDRPTPE